MNTWFVLVIALSSSLTFAEKVTPSPEWEWIRLARLVYDGQSKKHYLDVQLHVSRTALEIGKDYGISPLQLSCEDVRNLLKEKHPTKYSHCRLECGTGRSHRDTRIVLTKAPVQ